MNKYDRAAALFPRSIAAALKGATYGATAAVPLVSAAYVQTMRDADARAFWDSAVRRPVPTAPTLSGSRYVGGSSVPMRAR